jgi:hypothetical protein
MNFHAILGKIMTCAEANIDQVMLEVKGLPQNLQQRLVKTAFMEKCGINVLESYERWGILSKENQKELAIQRSKRASIGELLSFLPAEALLLKGPALARYYPFWISRFSGDLDVLVESHQDIRELGRRLSNIGMRQRLASLWVADLSGRLPLAGSIFYDDADSERNAVTVEIQIGGFPISMSGIVSFNALMKYSEHTLKNITPAATLTPTGQVCLILTDLAGKTKKPSATVRHVVDMIYLLEQVRNQINWEEVGEYVHRNAAILGLLRLEGAAKKCGLTKRLKSAGLSLKRTSFGLDFLLHKIQMFRVYSFFSRQNEDGILSSSLQMYRAITVKLRKYTFFHSFLRLLDTQRLTAILSRCGMRVVLVPICSSNTTKIGYLFLKGYNFLVHPLGIFLITQHGLVGESDREYFFKLIQSQLKVNRLAGE